MAATRRLRLAVERGVGIEQLVIMHWRSLETFGRRIVRSRSEEDLAKPKINLACKIGNHAPHMMGDDLQGGELVEYSRIYQPGHACGGLVRPAEAEPDLRLGCLLAGIIGKIGPTHRMYPDGQIMRRHAPEDRAKLRRGERLARDIGE